MSTETSNTGSSSAKEGGLLNSRHYALAILTLVYMSSFIDRQIISILLQPIKEEFGASDLQMGVLGGFVFAIFYATLGLPLALMADKVNRRNLITLAITIWSGMTALGGFAQSYTQLLLARIGVGIGEAGSGPASQSMIADLYPLSERTRAMAIYSSGITIGVSLGSLIGGTVAFYWSWQAALMVVGLPGLLIALVLRFTVNEPRRGQSDGVTNSPEPISMGQAAKEVFRFSSFAPIWQGLKFFWQSPTLRHTLIGCTLVAFIGYGAALYGPAYMMRMFGLNTRDVGILGAAGSIFAVAGGFGAAWVADHWGNNDPTWVPRIVAITKFITLPFIILYYLQDSLWVALAFYIPIIAFSATYQGSTYSMVQTLSPRSMRALSSAILLFVINLVGMGLGPTFVGFLSDNLVSVVGDDTQSLRWALAIVSCMGAWGAFHYYLASKTYPAELAAMQAKQAEEEASS